MRLFSPWSDADFIMNRRLSYREQRELRNARRDAVILFALAIALSLTVFVPVLMAAWNM